MTKSLRKIHLQIWIILALLLPAGMISAWLVIPVPAVNHLLEPPFTEALPVLLKRDEQRFPFISIRTNKDSSVLQLEFINANELVFASALIYELSDSSQVIEQGKLVGRIDMRGTYHFPLKKNQASGYFYFVMYDTIHHKIIQRINL